ncbi:MAG TPA: TonB-dependent receptor [Blastocatellia bacterium]|nr:TonB-dependent receptor [Blastocatellia bacterium]
MQKAISPLVATVIVCLSLIAPVFAQNGGAISGNVTDSSGSAVESAKVVLKNVATQVEQSAATDASGRYQLNEVPTGIYRVRVEKAGFSTAARNLTLASANEKIEANFELAPGDIAEQVSVTAARGERDALEIPVRAETITEDQLIRQNNTATQDLLTSVPNVTPVGNGPFQQRPRLRGLDSSRILIMVDGERLNNSRVATDRAGVEIGLIDPTAIQSVEVISGSGSVLYGADALSGTINILTDQPEGGADKVRLGFGFSQFQSTNESGLRLAGKVDLSGRRFAVRFSGGGENFNNYHAGKSFNESSVFLHQTGALRQQILSRVFPDPFNAPFTRSSSEIPNSSSEGHFVNGVGRIFFTDKDALRVNWNRRRAYDVGFPDFAEPFFFQVITLPFSNLDKYGLRYQRADITPWFTGLSVNVYHQVQDRNLRNDFAVFSSAPPPPGQQPLDSIIRIKLLTDTRQNVKSYGWDAQGTFLIKGRNILTAGASYFYDHSRDSRESRSEAAIIGFATRPPTPPRLIPQNIALGPPSITFPQRVPKSDFKNLGFFVQNELDVTRRLRIIGGLRVDRFDIETLPTPGYNPLLPGIDRATPPIDLSNLPSASGTSINRAAVAGDIGAVIRVTDYFSLSGRVGRSYRHPNLEELFFTGPATIGNLIANTEVKPETGVNVDVGAKLRRSRYAASFNYFNNSYRNFISAEIISNAPTSGLISQAINFARVRIQGFETDGEATFGLGNSIFTPFMAVAYLHGQIQEAVNPFSGASLNDVPADDISPLKAVTGIRWQTRRGRFWSEYNVRAQAKVDRVSPLLSESPFIIAQSLFALRGFGVHTLRGGVNFQRERNRFSFTVGLENLGNNFYREQFQFAPARGRSFTVGTVVRFY